MAKKQTYPYLTAISKPESWEFYVTIKPNNMTYVQGISKTKLARLKKKTASNKYLNRLNRSATGFSTRTRRESTRLFYQDVFGVETKFKSRLP